MKPFLKSMTLVIITIFICSAVGTISAWYTMNRSVQVAIPEIADVHYVDLLFPVDAAPFLSPEELADRNLPEPYAESAYRDAVNGYRDADGFGSVLLYCDEAAVVLLGDGLYRFGYRVEGSLTFKIAIIYADGSMDVSEPVTQTKPLLQASYDLTSVQYAEYDTLFPPADDPDAWDDWYLERSVKAFLFASLVGLVHLVLLFAFGYRRRRTFVLTAAINQAVIAVVIFVYYVDHAFVLPVVYLLTYVAPILATVLEIKILTSGNREHPLSRALAFVGVADLLLFAAIGLWVFELV
ncbi:MAG: hypothetical protein WC509_05580 [Candidatus Izemoplasmatales bacterium]